MRRGMQVRMKRILVAIAALIGVSLLLLILAAGLLLWSAHRQVDAALPALPEIRELMQVDAAGDLPIRLVWINTASQRSDRSAVIEPSLDPDPLAPYVMSHASFALEWTDGRILLIDTGMTREGARAFSATLELLGADPIVPLGSVGEQLGPRGGRVAGVAFTHLHTDHTGGLVSLCEGRDGALPVFHGTLQLAESNYTTRAGLDDIAAAPCAELKELRGEGRLGVPGFPGVSLVPAGGHTPGSQLFAAHVRTAVGVRAFVFTGDLVNHAEGVRSNLAKPHLYSLLMVPEATERLEQLRLYLRDIGGRPGAQLLVSHDQLSLEISGLEQLGPRPAPR